jgi:hypothetical protein
LFCFVVFVVFVLLFCCFVVFVLFLTAATERQTHGSRFRAGERTGIVGGNLGGMGGIG